jgi:drug/metabolite transporter (DMT)-like permease
MVLGNRSKGILFTLSGILLMIPDALFIRLSALDGWPLIFWRGALAGAVFLLIVLFHCWQRRSFGCWRLGRSGLLLSVALPVACCSFVLSMVQTKAANVLIILALAPMFSALFDRYFRQLRVNRRTWYAMLACLVGVVVLVADGLEAGSSSGDYFALVTAVSLGAMFSLISCTRSESVNPALCLGYLLTALIAAAVSPSLYVPPASIPSVLVIGLLIVPFAFLLASKGPRYLPAPEVALFLLLETVFSPLLLWAVLGEEPGRYVLLGGLIVICTLVWHSSAELLRERRNVWAAAGASAVNDG